MIDEDATHEAYGYYSTDLPRRSHKPIVAACDDCGKVKTNSKNQYHPLCKSCVRKGENNPMFGKYRTEVKAFIFIFLSLIIEKC